MRLLNLLTTASILMTAGLTLGQTNLRDANAGSGLHLGDNLAVSIDKIGISLYNAKTGIWARTFKSDTQIQDMKAFGDKIAWIAKDSRTVEVSDPATGKTQEFLIPGTVLFGEIQRLSIWKDQIIAHSESDIAFIDPQSGMIRRGYDCLPKEVWDIAKQGVTDSEWHDGQGIFISVRRAGTRQVINDSAEIRDIGMVTAWSGDSLGQMRLLGAYTCSLSQFHDAPGERVRIKMGPQMFEAPFGSASIGNMKLGPEGLIGFGLDEVFVVPFFQNSWLPDRVKTAFRPKYSSKVDYSQESGWWTDGKVAYRADLADGSTDAYLPKSGEQIRNVVADPDGAFLLTDKGVERIDTDTDSNLFTKISAASGTDPQFHEQLMLLRAIQAKMSTGMRSHDAILELYSKASGVKIKALPGKSDKVDEVELGDLIEQDGTLSIYLGGGNVLSTDAGTLGAKRLQPSVGMSFYRPLSRNPIKPSDLILPHIAPVVKPNTTIPTYIDPAYAPVDQRTTAFSFTKVVPIGVNRPKPSLGNSFYAYAATGAEFDQPDCAADRRLMSIAQSWVGTPYRWGGNTKDGVDCSGFVVAVYKEMGIRLPRFSQDIGKVSFGKVVRGELHFGDVLVFQSPQHVALYVGNGQTIEAISGGVGYSRISRRSQAIVRRFLD
ncbi:hypothetical protein BH11ARM1_BH11ARM1_07220 [soil metagenome]